MSLNPQQVIHERYEIVRIIKSGGMGAVYEAIDSNLASTPCAVKEVLSSAMIGPDAAYVLGSFEKEMRALAQLEHPNIPRVRDYFEIEGQRYIVLDLVRGKPLDDELGEHLRLTGKPMEPAVVALDMVGVLETLSYLHGEKIVHRDVKSANLIRDQRTGKIKLVDFGIARSVESQRVQTQVGTPGFCAPEQMAGRAEARSDIYSVGATLFHLITGKLPPAFTFDPLEVDLPEHPKLAEVIKKATAMKPAERYANAEEMAEVLRRWLRNEVSTKIAPTQLPARHTVHPLATPPTPPNHQNYVYLFLTVIVLGAASLLFPWRAGQGPVPPLPRPATPEAPSPIPSPLASSAAVVPVARPAPSTPAPPARAARVSRPKVVARRPDRPGTEARQPTLPSAPGYVTRAPAQRSRPEAVRQPPEVVRQPQVDLPPTPPPASATRLRPLPSELAGFRRQGQGLPASPGGALFRSENPPIDIRVRVFPGKDERWIAERLGVQLPRFRDGWGRLTGNGGLFVRKGVLFEFSGQSWSDYANNRVIQFFDAWSNQTD